MRDKKELVEQTQGYIKSLENTRSSHDRKHYDYYANILSILQSSPVVSDDLVEKKEIVGHMLNVSNKLFAWCAGSNCNECKKVVLKRGNHYEVCNIELAGIRKLLKSRQPGRVTVTREEIKDAYYDSALEHTEMRKAFDYFIDRLKSIGINVTKK